MTASRAALRALLGQIDLHEALRRRAVQDAVSMATADHWEWKAQAFEWARPRPGDYLGQATTVDDLLARDERCRATAEACRRHAELLRAEPADG